MNTRKIDFYAFIEHMPEDDETKVHRHLFIVPNGRVDTDQITNELIEPNLEDPLKPFKCISCRPSKFDEWYFYGLHDKTYLVSKGQMRRHHYSKANFYVSDADYFNELIHQIDYTRFSRFGAVLEAVDEGFTFADLLRTGLIPFQQTLAYRAAYEALSNNITARNGRSGHDVDESTGEVKD